MWGHRVEGAVRDNRIILMKGKNMELKWPKELEVFSGTPILKTECSGEIGKHVVEGKWRFKIIFQKFWAFHYDTR